MVRKWKLRATKKGGIHMKKRDDIVNGHMTNSMEDVIFLGKQMENMRDGMQLEEDDRVADPKQFDDDFFEEE